MFRQHSAIKAYIRKCKRYSNLDNLETKSFVEAIRNLLGENKMKWLLMLVWLSVAACSGQPTTHGFYDNSESATARHEIATIDSTIRQLDYEYAKASNAISVNDAEKVYLQRFEEDLLKKREAICDRN